MKTFATLLLLVLSVVGCTHVEPRPCGDPVKVPAPYWHPPQNIKPLPPEQPLITPTIPSLEPTATDAERERSLEAVAQDFMMMKGDDALCRFMYDELVKLCTSEPVEPVVPPADPPD